MVNFGEKAKIKKAGNFNSGRSYVITTVQNILVLFLQAYYKKVVLGKIPVLIYV
jgi:hypothetical protein